jgi:photosystem II stability/assembly factor-like uncharacterized protein
MDDFTYSLDEIIDDTQLPARPSLEGLRKRTRRRGQRRAVGSSVVIVALVVGLVLGFTRGHSPSPGGLNSVTELTAFKAGRSAFVAAGGPPVFSYGVIAPNQLWVLNGDGLFISTNRASSFQTITPPLGGSPITRVLAVQFLNPSDGWVLVNTSEGPTLGLYRTTDGGSNWAFASLPTLTPDGINGATMDIVNDDIGFIALNGYVSQGNLANLLLSTTDGGSAWTVVNGASPVRYVSFSGSELGWGIDREVGANHLYRTNDGGRTWTAASPSLEGSDSGGSDVQSGAVSWELPTFFGERGVLIGRTTGPGSNRLVIATSGDGGSSWSVAARPPFTQPTCGSSVCIGTLPFSAASATQWFYWSGLDLYSTEDSGKSWTERLPNIAFAQSDQAIVNFVSGSQYGNLTSPIVFTSATDGWAIASSGSLSLILSTRNAGQHFAAFHSPSGTP